MSKKREKPTREELEYMIGKKKLKDVSRATRRRIKRKKAGK